MTCHLVPLPGGGKAIVCTRERTQPCQCGNPSTLLCDWKDNSRTGTCDAPICSACTTSPAPDKDLCPEHARAFEKWKQRHRRKRASS